MDKLNFFYNFYDEINLKAKSVDRSETSEILNWSPIQSPEDGLKEAVEYYLVHK